MTKDDDIKAGAVYAGLFASDGSWHRVRIEGRSPNGQWRGFFLDYGNRELVETATLRTLDDELARIHPTARQMFLAGLKAPVEGSDYFEPAGQAFSDLVWDKEMVANVELEEYGGKYHVVLQRPGQTEGSVNQALLESAFIRVHPRPPRKLKEKNRGAYTPFYQKLLELEAIAKSSHKNLWEYGDVSDEDEDERDDRGRVPSKKAKEKEAKDKEAKKEKEKAKEVEKKAKESKQAATGKGKEKGGDKGGDKGKAAGGDKGKAAGGDKGKDKGGKKK